MWFKRNYTSEKWIENSGWNSQCLVEILLDTAWLELTKTSPPAFFERLKRFGADCWNFFGTFDNCGTTLNDVSHRDFQLSEGRITKMGPNRQTCKVGGSPFTGCSVNFQIPNVWNPGCRPNQTFFWPRSNQSHKPSIRQIQHASNH
jgi:hypothetical protein